MSSARRLWLPSFVGVLALLAFLAALVASRPESRIRRLASAASAAVGGDEPASTCRDYTSFERKFARAINRSRARAGRDPLRLDRELSEVSRVHTDEMVEEQRLYHTATSVFGRRVTDWTTLGENVGVGATVGSLHAAFMNSPSHRANILYPGFRYVGVGVRTSRDRMWVTVSFERFANPESALAASC